MLLATASQAALDRSSSGRITTWLRTPTRPFSRRQPITFKFAPEPPPASLVLVVMAIAVSSPALRFHVVDMQMLALADVGHGSPDVLSILHDRLARLDVAERDLVADRDRGFR